MSNWGGARCAPVKIENLDGNETLIRLLEMRTRAFECLGRVGNAEGRKWMAEDVGL